MNDWIKLLIEDVLRIAYSVLKKFLIRNTQYAIRSLIFFTGIFLIACNAPPPVPPSSQPGPTGIEVAPEFAAFYDNFGGLRIFGYAITESFQDDPDSGRTVQYFQNMRLEYDPSLEENERVQIASLGEWAFTGVTSVTPAATSNSGQSRAFAGGLLVEDEFLTFYEEYQGEQLFGPPISPLFDEGGQRVQYFRNGRLEWDPNQPSELRIQVSRLGQAHFEDSGAILVYEEQGGFQPVPWAGLRQATVTASVSAPVLYQGDEQVLSVEVRSPQNRPVAGIPVTATLTYNGTTRTIELGPTDAAGRISHPIDVADAEPGLLVKINVVVNGDNGAPIGETSLSFKPWWE